MRARRFHRLLTQVLAVSTGGCCSLIGGFPSKPWVETWVGYAVPGSLDGAVDSTTCSRACGEPVDACERTTEPVTTDGPSKLPDALVECQAPDGTRSRRRHRDYELAKAHMGEGKWTQALGCASFCSTSSSSSQSGWRCRLDPRVTFDETSPRVACRTNHDSECVLRLPSGRATEGIQPASPHPSDLRSWFALAEELERISVSAFSRLARELESHAAPRGLVRRARVARRDELRHVRAMMRLGAAFGGGAPQRRSVRASRRIRPLAEIAVENAVEGCINETLGAAIALYQARHAHDATVRSELARVARDEVAHAELAWSIHAWVMKRLPMDERRAITSAMTRAASSALRLHARVPDATRALIGYPCNATLQAIAEVLGAALFMSPTKQRALGPLRGMLFHAETAKSAGLVLWPEGFRQKHTTPAADIEALDEAYESSRTRRCGWPRFCRSMKRPVGLSNS